VISDIPHGIVSYLELVDGPDVYVGIINRTWDGKISAMNS
jgi:hypothetical protein